MNGFFQQVMGLLTLRAGPQDLPASRVMTVMVIFAYLATVTLTAQNLGDDSNVSRALLATAIQFLAVGIILKVRGHLERLDQTLMAFASTGVFLSVLSFALLVQANPDVDQPMLAMMWLVIFAWSLAVDANIFRHALSVSMSIGVLISVVLLALSYAALEVIFR